MTILVEKEVQVSPRFCPPAVVQWDLDPERFYKLYVDLMKREGVRFPTPR